MTSERTIYFDSTLAETLKTLCSHALIDENHVESSLAVILRTSLGQALIERNQVHVILLETLKTLDGLAFFGHGSFSYVDERYGSVQNFPATLFGSMEILNLRLGIRGDKWSLTAYGNNLLNDLEKQASVAPSNGAFVDENGFNVLNI